jgi:LicD family
VNDGAPVPQVEFVKKKLEWHIKVAAHAPEWRDSRGDLRGMVTNLSRQSVRDICKAGWPGLIHFAGPQNLRVQIDAPIRELRLHIPDIEYLNLEGLKITTRDGATLPNWMAHVSSAISESVSDAARLLSGTTIHTKKEPLPWWRMQFDAPAAISQVDISNRPDRWAARAYGLCVEWLREDGVSETFDNLAVPTVLARLDVFHARLRRVADGLLDAPWCADISLRRPVEGVVQGFFDLIGAMRGALVERSAPPATLFALRAAVLAELVDLITRVDDDRLRALAPFAEIVETLIWKGYDAPAAEMPAEAALMSFVLATLFVRDGWVAFPRFIEFQRFLPTKEHIERLERGIEQFCARLGGDPALFPIMVRPHGILGSTLVREEMAYVQSVREVIGILGELGYHAALCQGTLLGAVREQRLLPHDDDVDIMFVAKSTSEQDLAAELKNLIDMLASSNITAERVENLLFFKMTAPQAGKTVDVFPAYPANRDILRIYMQDLEWRDVPRAIVEPLGAISFYGELAPVPARAEEFLALRFGADWRVPNRFSRLWWLRPPVPAA